jgi:energy-coupling factor transporter ATP-binding protein EcfA2
MNKITIRKIGPIDDVTIDLNKINVIMGPQSSGKSTIAKIISYCTWVEKDVAVNQSLDAYSAKGYFQKKLEDFHKLKGYFKRNSEIHYQSDIIKLNYSNQKLEIEWVDKYAYKRSKIAYIPSERNIVIMPEMEKVDIPNNNIRSFLFDWFDARKVYSKEKDLSVLGLGMSYYYNDESKENHITVSKGNDKYDILLPNASSGLQSLVPLVVTIEYLTMWIYENELDLSFEEKEKRTKVTNILSIERVIEPFVGKKINKIDESIIEKYDEITKLLEAKDKTAHLLISDFLEKTSNLFKSNNTQFIIEEPEQNLFPEAQRDLVYYLLGKCKDEVRDHRLTLTTHSPYILYALNNSMMGYLVKDKMPELEQGELKCRSAWIDPKLVSIWEIEDGKIKSIQGEDGLIGNNYFDISMKKVMDDFYAMLNYYGDEE